MTLPWGSSRFDDAAAQVVGGGAAAPTSPPSTALWGWWDAQHSYTETAGTPTTLITVDGTQIGSQLDRSSNNRHLYQATVAAQPVFKTGVLNSLAAARYNGSTTSLATSSAPSGDNFSMYVVANQTAVESNYDGLITSNDSGFSPRYALLGNAGANLRVFNNATGATDAFSATTYHLATGTVNNNSPFATTMQIDNNTITTGNVSGNGGLGTGVAIGAFFNGFWAGDIVEALLYTATHTLSSGDGLLARRYLNGKYALGLGI